MNIEDISKKLIEKGLKVTPQRIAILEAIIRLNNHPTADQIMDYIRKTNPNISLATVYKVLDALVKNGLIKNVKTDKDIKRYDALLENHHHIYFSDSEEIEDYTDDELNGLLKRYFEKKKIPDFKIEDIKLQIIGKYIKASKTK
jgi:Fur family peroxide stress response transcriptional regulator